LDKKPYANGGFAKQDEKLLEQPIGGKTHYPLSQLV